MRSPTDRDAGLLSAYVQGLDQPTTPFSVPGHKRRAALLDEGLGRATDTDVPLFAGLDTMKLTAGTLERAEQQAAELWGADWCRFGTCGSSQANHALMLALGSPGSQSSWPAACTGQWSTVWCSRVCVRCGCPAPRMPAPACHPAPPRQAWTQHSLGTLMPWGSGSASPVISAQSPMSAPVRQPLMRMACHWSSTRPGELTWASIRPTPRTHSAPERTRWS